MSSTEPEMREVGVYGLVYKEVINNFVPQGYSLPTSYIAYGATFQPDDGTVSKIAFYKDGYWKDCRQSFDGCQQV